MKTPLAILAGLSLPCAAIAQLNPGDVGVAGFSTTSFGVINNSVGTAVTTGGFGGSGTSQAILWDPNSPQDFLVGGFGFVGRATMTGPGSATYSLLTTGVGTASQMSWNWLGQVVVADAGTDQVRVYDPIANTVTDLTVGTQPWTTTLNAGAFEWSTGDVIVGGNGGIYRLPFNQTVATPIVTGLSGYISGIAFDLAAPGDVIATVITANRLIRVSPTGAVTDIFVPGTLTSMNSIDQDLNLDWIVGTASANVYRVPYLGGAPQLIGGVVGIGTSAAGVSVVRSGSGGFAAPYGAACNGAFGPVQLSAVGAMTLGNTVMLESGNHAPGQLGAVIFGLSNTFNGSLPLPAALDPLLGTQGCFLHASIDATALAITSVTSPATMSLPFTLPANPTGWRFWVQHACFEPVAGGLSWSNGLILQLP